MEVWRQSATLWPLVNDHNDIVGVVTNDELQTRVPIWPDTNIPQLADPVLVRMTGQLVGAWNVNIVYLT